jgi:hypothetical protein
MRNLTKKTIGWILAGCLLAGAISFSVIDSANGQGSGLGPGGGGSSGSVAVGSITGMGAGCATFLATPSSANLRGCITDESGSGVTQFGSGALGTPLSGVATNLTGTAAALSIGGNAATATALAANPADCTGGQYAHTIAASGALTCSTPSGTTTSGTCTVTLIGTTLAGSGTYAYQQCTWTKIARDTGFQWFVRIAIRATVGTQTGNARLEGLPIAANNTTNEEGACAISNYQGIAAAGKSQLGAIVIPNTTQIALRASGLGTTFSDIAIADWSGNGLVHLACNYTTAT